MHLGMSLGPLPSPDWILHQRARQALDRFHFVQPPVGGLIHCNQFDEVLQLQVDIFCEDVCKATDLWLSDVDDGAEVQKQMAMLMNIQDLGDGGFVL